MAKTKKNNISKKGAAIYIRVSTDAQFEEGYSVDAQKDRLTSYCQIKDIKIYDYYIDGGYTGSNMDRPELQRLISDIKKEKISTVIVYKLDRLSRSQKDTMYLIEDVFNPNGIDFISLSENFDTSTAMGKAVLGVLSIFAQLERENIRERTRMGMQERVKSGLWPGGGRTPFGYDYDPQQGKLIPNQDAEKVRKMYDLYLQGYSTGRIAKIMGLKYDKLVSQILMRKSNAGYIVYNGQEYLGKHDPIISLDTYNKTIELMQERAVKHITESNYLFTGLIECGKCGAKMRYQKWGKYDCKIVCYSQDKYKKHLVKDPNCNNIKNWASEIEDIVIKDLFHFASRQKDFKDDDEISIETTLDFLNKQYDETNRRLKRLYNLYAQSEDDVLLETIDEYKKQLSDIHKQIMREEEKSILANKINSTKQILKTLKETWDYMTDKEKKNVIRSCIDKIVITDNNIDVFYKFADIINKE